MMRVVSFLRRKAVKPVGLALGFIALSVLANCTTTSAPRCTEIVSQSTKDHLLGLIKPVLEVQQSAGGLYTLGQHLERNIVSYSDCGSVYQIAFTPTVGKEGKARTEEKVTYVLSKETGKVVKTFTGAPSFEVLDLSHFEDGLVV